MKKLISLLLALAMMSACFTAVAEGLTLDKIVDEPIDIVEMPKKDLSEDKAAHSLDKVTRKDGFVSVTLENGLTLSMDIPQNVYTLTQNYLLDIDLYSAVFSDPTSTLQHFIEKKMHLNMFTFGQDNFDTYVYVYEKDSIGAYIINANDMTEDDANMIAQYLDSQTGFTFKYGKLGDQIWFMADNIANGKNIVFFTWANGCMIKAIANVTSSAQGENALAALAALKISAN